MANSKKKKAQQKKRKAQAGGGGPKKPPQQGSGQPATASTAQASSQRPPSNKPQKQAKQAKAAGERRMSSSERRAAARKAQRRKRQITTIVIPIVVILVLIVGLILINGGVEGGGKTSSASDIKTDAKPRQDALAVGEAPPAFTAPELTSGSVNTADYEGKPHVIPVWAAWCPNCQKELPILEKLSKQYPDVPIFSVVTSQGQEPGPTPEKYVADNNITFPVAVDDSAGTLRQAYGVTSFPTVYWIGADGKVANVTIGLREEAELNDSFAQIQATASGASPSPAKKN